MESGPGVFHRTLGLAWRRARERTSIPGPPKSDRASRFVQGEKVPGAGGFQNRSTPLVVMHKFHSDHRDVNRERHMDTAWPVSAFEEDMAVHFPTDGSRAGKVLRCRCSN